MGAARPSWPPSGAFIVRIPAAIFLALDGSRGSALILTAWGTLVVERVLADQRLEISSLSPNVLIRHIANADVQRVFEHWLECL